MSTPLLICTTGRQARELRKHLYMNQTEFWARADVSQSGGARYESGRDAPVQVLYMIHLAYGTDEQAAELMEWIRNR